MEKTKRQVLIYAQYQQARAQARIKKLSTADKLWEDEDFESMKMDEYCQEIRDSLNDDRDTLALATVAQVKILRLWRETWEKKKIGPKRDQILEAR